MTNKSVSVAPASSAKIDLFLDRIAARHSGRPRVVCGAGRHSKPGTYLG